MEKYKLSYLELYDKFGDSDSSSSSNGSNSNIIGDSNKYGTSDAEAADIRYIVGQMKKNSDKWSKNMTKDQKDELNQKNWDWSKQLNSKYKLGVYYDGSTGIWYDKDHDNIYDKYLGKLHSGGVVGDFSTLRQDEMIATLQKGEIVLDKPKQQSLDSILKVMSAITSGLSASALPDLSKTAQMPVSGVNREVVTIPKTSRTLPSATPSSRVRTATRLSSMKLYPAAWSTTLSKFSKSKNNGRRGMFPCRAFL